MESRDAQQSLRGPGRFPSTLLPILQCSSRYAEQSGKCTLRKPHFCAGESGRRRLNLGDASSAPRVHIADGFQQVRLELLHFLIHSSPLHVTGLETTLADCRTWPSYARSATRYTPHRAGCNRSCVRHHVFPFLGWAPHLAQAATTRNDICGQRIIGKPSDERLSLCVAPDVGRIALKNFSFDARVHRADLYGIAV